ncbi:hypothetical protein QBC44DRAFT_298820 [Cladorrhinum sp. PSN332]|nr:hypothetical protein QBC44DRAFT_298820 [Cladorrhinum sp. PSN332]
MGLGFFLCRVAFFGVSVHSLAFPGPRPTAANDMLAAPAVDGWASKPTTAPSPHHVLRRQNTRASTYMVAPDNVCGFVDKGQKDLQPYSCGTSATCAFLPSSPGNPGAVGCCSDAASCSFRSGCMAFDDLKGCNEDCVDDPAILKCSRSSAQFCNTVAYSGGTIDYYCDSSSASRIQSAQLSKPGQKSRSLAKVVVTVTTTPVTRPTSTRARSSGKPASTTSVQDSNLAINPDTPPESDPSTISTAPAATSSTAEAAASAPASSNTGAIAGGVAGGLAGLGLIIFAVFFFLGRKKNKEAEAPNMAQNSPSSPPSAPSPAPSNPFNDPPSQENVSFSQLASAFPKVPEPLNISRPGTAASVKRPITPSQFSPLSAVTIAATAAAISDNVKKTTVIYPEPSPMSTPNGSPRSARYQPPDLSSFYPNYPQYRPPSSRSQSGLQSGWPASPTMGRESSVGGGTSPASAYGAFPVSPVSALGSHPAGKEEIGIPNFPLVLQPGMGMQRLPPGTVRQVTLQRGASRRNRESQAQAQAQGQPNTQAQGDGGKSSSPQDVMKDQTTTEPY